MVFNNKQFKFIPEEDIKPVKFNDPIKTGVDIPSVITMKILSCLANPRTTYDGISEFNREHTCRYGNSNNRTRRSHY